MIPVLPFSIGLESVRITLTPEVATLETVEVVPARVNALAGAVVADKDVGPPLTVNGIVKDAPDASSVAAVPDTAAAALAGAEFIP